MTRPIPVALHHTCFLVHDVEATAQKMANALGIGPWNVWTINPTECRVHGKVGAFSFRIALATVGGGTFELAAPHEGRSVYNEHLEQHGEGYHHTCLVYPTLAAVREAIMWEVGFAPEACRSQRMHGLVVVSLADGRTRFAIGGGEWRWSDLLGVHQARR